MSHLFPESYEPFTEKNARAKEMLSKAKSPEGFVLSKFKILQLQYIKKQATLIQNCLFLFLSFIIESVANQPISPREEK
jgi:hypothetical protein